MELVGLKCGELGGLGGRPGRLEVQIEIGLPDEAGRVKILQIHSNKMRENSFLANDVDLPNLGTARHLSLVHWSMGPLLTLLSSPPPQPVAPRTSAGRSWRGW